jgi:hypothetical protein
MGLKKAKYVIKSCKDCPFYRFTHIYESDDELRRNVHDYFNHYCNGQCVESKELKRKWFLKEKHCLLIRGYEECNITDGENNVEV